MKRFYLKIALVVFVASTARGQSEEQATRTAEIEKQRAEKAAHLVPDDVTPAERFAGKLRDNHWLDRTSYGFNGFRAKIGNMVTGGGFAIGPEYLRDDLGDGKYSFDVSAQVSTRGYLKGEAGFGLMKLLDGHSTLSARTTYRNYSGINYYGPGPDSEKTGRSVYRLEDTSADVLATLTPVKYVNFGASVGKLWTNIGPGDDDRYISTDLQFNESTTPGLTRQTDFLRTRAFVQFDTRDFPMGPKSGSNVVFMESWYADRDLKQFSFRKTDIEVQQLIPFLNKTRRIALRAKGAFTNTNGANQVPFFLQPILGGSDDLRGYRFFRFYDRNLIVYNAEYQWEIFSGLEGAVFFDAGKVMPKWSDLRFSNLETSAGFGLRFNARNATFLRVDVGFSHEGFQVWLKFNDLFNSRKFGTAMVQPLY